MRYQAVRYWVRGNSLFIVFLCVVLLLIGALMFFGPTDKTTVTVTNDGPTRIVCETSGPDVMICTSSTSVVRTPTVQPR